jgi:small subunit ribosomal protein S9
MAATSSNFIAATGRRKTSIASVRLSPGDGKVLINDRDLDDYLTVPSHRFHAVQPLVDSTQGKKYNATIKVVGGGISGQAGAIRQALARALLKASPDLKPLLRSKGFLTRDSRMKERKKYGQPGARKRFQFSKR